MNKNEFLNQLNNSLKNFSLEEKNEIIYDYEEHFTVAFGNGKTEDEVCKELGDPSNIAKQYKINASIEKASSNPSASNIFRAVLACVGLGLVNLIFVLGPFLAVFIVLLSLILTSAAMIAVGMIGVLVILLKQLFPFLIPSANFSSWIAVMFYGIGTTSLGMLFYMGASSLTRLFFRATLKYLKMNLNVIIGRGHNN